MYYIYDLRFCTQSPTATPQLDEISTLIQIKVTTRGNLSSSLITWLIFASVTLFFPTTSLIVRASQNHPLLMNFFEIIMIPFAAMRERFPVGR